MKNTNVATRSILAAAAGATLLALSLGGCKSTVNPAQPTPTPVPRHPGPHSGADAKDMGPVGSNPGPHS